MTTPTPPSYATVGDFELITGIDVPPDKEDTVQKRLDIASSYVALYLAPCADEVAEKFPDILTSVVCNHVYRVASVPTGVASESVGATSVSYRDSYELGDFIPSESAILDALLAQTSCGESGAYAGVGEVGVNWGGPSGSSASWDTL